MTQHLLNLLRFPNVRFHCASEFFTLRLALMLNSLVRVSRRVESYHFVEILTRREPSPSNYATEVIHSSTAIPTQLALNTQTEVC